MRALVVSLVSCVVCLVAVGGGGAATPTVTVKMSDFKFTLSKKTVQPGKVVFRVQNTGGTGHDFKINGKKTPIYAPGKAGILAVTFPNAGRYAFLCTVPGHANLGMKGVLVVKVSGGSGGGLQGGS